MSAFRLFGKSAANEAAERILVAVSQAARDPDLYGEGRAPDTLDGRFEMLAAFAAIALLRLRAAPEAERVAQAFTDRLFRNLDYGLREAGVGDLSVAKHMKQLAGRFYGRLAAYDAGLASRAALTVAVARNVWNDETAPFAPVLAERLAGLSATFAALPAPALEEPGRWITKS